MPVTDLPIFSTYSVQRFSQFGSSDLANWYPIAVENTKKGQALYPAMGRKRITSLGINELVFTQEPSQIFKSINYIYLVVGTQIIQVDKNFNQLVLGNVQLGATVWFAYLVVGKLVYVMLTDGKNIYVITESPTVASTYQMVTDANAPGNAGNPGNPTYIAAFNGRFVVSLGGTNEFFLSNANFVGGISGGFTTDGAALGNTASGVIGQMTTLHAQLYVFCDFTTDIWSNIPSPNINQSQSIPFPWKLNSSYNWNYGIADPFSLDVDFGRMVWLARNSAGLVTFMTSNGQQPVDISTEAVNVLLQNSNEFAVRNPFLVGNNDGFLYQYENTIFYRISAGDYKNYGVLDVGTSAYALEFNFQTNTWARVIELNGERNRIEKHIYFNGLHLVTVQDDGAVYQMAGNIYYNELRNPAQDNPQAIDAFLSYPMRYELVTQQIYQEDYSEFITDYIEIDFVFGDSFYKNDAPFANTIFVITEDAAPGGAPIYVITEDADSSNQPIFVITEDGNTPGFADNFYNTLFKPNIGLYYSDDGGVTYQFREEIEFSQLGQYRWRMRWFELGTSRNRTYKLICVSSLPIVILGGVQSIRRASGGAN